MHRDCILDDRLIASIVARQRGRKAYVAGFEKEQTIRETVKKVCALKPTLQFASIPGRTMIR